MSRRARVIRSILVVAMGLALGFAWPTWSTLAVLGALCFAWIGGTCLGIFSDEYWPTRRERWREYGHNGWTPPPNPYTRKVAKDPRRWS